MRSRIQQSTPLWKLLISTLVIIAVLYGLCVFVILFLLPEDWGTRGSIGDSFGVINSVFTALAFAAVVVSLIYQRKELLTTLEDVQTSEQLQAEALQAQRDALVAMKEQTIALYRPYIVARVELRAGTFIALVIENTGRTAARELELRTDLDFVYPGGIEYGKHGTESQKGKLSEAYAFQHRIDTFAPGQKLFYHIAVSGEIYRTDPDFKSHRPLFKIDATYSFQGSGKVTEQYVIDMRTFRNSFVEEERSEVMLKRIATKIDDLNTTLKTKLPKPN